MRRTPQQLKLEAERQRTRTRTVHPNVPGSMRGVQPEQTVASPVKPPHRRPQSRSGGIRPLPPAGSPQIATASAVVPANVPSAGPRDRAPSYISNLSGTITVQPYVPNDTSYHYRPPSNDLLRRVLAASDMVASGQVAHEKHKCARTVMNALEAAGAPLSRRADACDLPEALEESGWVKVENGDYQTGDIVGWRSYGSGAGARYGHVGFVASPGTAVSGKRVASSAQAKLAASRQQLSESMGMSVDEYIGMLSNQQPVGSLIGMPEEAPEPDRQTMMFLLQTIDDTFPPEIAEFVKMVYEGVQDG